MALTRNQRRNLEQFKEHKEKSLTAYSVWKTGLKRTVIMTIICLGAALFYFWGDWPKLAWFFVGCWFASMLIYFRISRAWSKNWPFLKEVIDWGKIESLLEGDGEPSSTKPNDGA